MPIRSIVSDIRPVGQFINRERDYMDDLEPTHWELIEDLESDLVEEFGYNNEESDGVTSGN